MKWWTGMMLLARLDGCGAAGSGDAGPPDSGWIVVPLPGSQDASADAWTPDPANPVTTCAEIMAGVEGYPGQYIPGGACALVGDVCEGFTGCGAFDCACTRDHRWDCPSSGCAPGVPDGGRP